jgi:ribose-phosphate pyrophosphokinase
MIKVNKQLLPITMFPDNTSQVWKLPESFLSGKSVSIEWDFSSESELMQLAQLKCLLASNGIQASLSISYLPYGRQDKEVANDATFALTVFAQMLNNMNFSDITILDPHSIRATELINNSIAVYPVEQVKLLFKEHADIVCYPDKGALAKYKQVYPELSYIYGEKVRDQASGKILKYEVIGEAKGKRVLIIDDICDGGQTFRLLAQDLLLAGAKSVALFVTHGIFSNGTRSLFESGINQIFTKQGSVSRRHKSLQF